MSDLLVLLLGESPEAPLRWGFLRTGSLVENGVVDCAASLSGLPEGVRDAERIVALLPGEQVAVRRMPSAPKGAAKALAAASLLIEDELGEPAETLHIALSPTASGYRTIAVRRNIMDDWRAAFLEAGVSPDILSTDYLALPLKDDAAVLVCESERVVGACRDEGFAVESALFSSLGAGLFLAPPARVDVFGDAEVAARLAGESAVNWLGPAKDEHVLPLYAEGAEKAPNLLQGRYVWRRALAPELALWRRAGAMAAGLAAVLALTLVLEALRADRTAARWTALAQEVHASAYPEAASADPAAHARSVLNAGGGAAFTALSTHFAEALDENESVVIERVRFNAARGEYVVSLASPSDDGIETLRAALSARGVEAVDHGGYRRDGGTWTGELTARAQ